MIATLFNGSKRDVGLRRAHHHLPTRGWVVGGGGANARLGKAVQSEDVCRLTRWKQRMDAALFGPGRFPSNGPSDAQIEG